MASNKKLTLTYPHPDPMSPAGKLYRVEKITNSVDYAPWSFLRIEEVDELCDSADWTVTILPYEKETQR